MSDDHDPRALLGDSNPADGLTPGGAQPSADHEPFRARTKSFTRRSRALQPTLRHAMEEFGASVVVPVRRGVGHTTVAEDLNIDWDDVFGRSAPLTVEIGAGDGEQIVAAAQRWPDRDFLAFEVWEPGVARLVSRVGAAGVSNVRVLEADAAQAFPILLPAGSLSELWTFFPDPWRKARHRKRRLVSDDFALEASRVLADGGVWRLATDWDDYAWQMRDVIEACPSLGNPHLGERPDPADPDPERGGFAPRWEGRVITHFETRGHTAGRHAHDIVAVKVPHSPNSTTGLALVNDPSPDTSR